LGGLGGGEGWNSTENIIDRTVFHSEKIYFSYPEFRLQQNKSFILIEAKRRWESRNLAPGNNGSILEHYAFYAIHT